MIDDASVRTWVDAYERAWRTAGTDTLAELFSEDATYLTGPFEEPHRGLEAIAVLWDAERSGPDEEFEMAYDVVAVDHPRAVVRLDVQYGPPTRAHWKDLWILELDEDGRCRSFEEWPLSPSRHAAG